MNALLIVLCCSLRHLLSRGVGVSLKIEIKKNMKMLIQFNDFELNMVEHNHLGHCGNFGLMEILKL